MTAFFTGFFMLGLALAENGAGLAERRAHMMERDIEGRGIRDPRVLRAMRTVPRHDFVPAAQRKQAYADSPLPIEHGQTISQPYIVALMTELAHVGPDSVVLEVGTGSGYQAAVLAEIVREVYSIEIIPELAESARTRLRRLGYGRVQVKAGDGYLGWPEHAPFDAILATAAPEKIPAPLLEQLKPGGRLVIPVGPVHAVQDLKVIIKNANGSLAEESVIPVRFVPMTGQAAEREP